MATFPNVEAFLLVGGKSSRMGRDKALLEFSGAPLLQRTVDMVAPLVSKITLATAASAAFPVNTNRYFNFGLPTIADRWPNFGPLGAIATVLSSTQTPWSLILACDMPFLTAEWLTFLLNQIPQTVIEDAIVPETARGLEPLCAVYNSRCGKILTAALNRDVRKVTYALAELNIKRIGQKDWRKFSPDGNLFQNLNTWKDYLDAQQQLNT
jgi:molybdopterin-guanine dinucleotide biosynthesis protein A